MTTESRLLKRGIDLLRDPHFNKSTTFSNGICEAHFVSRYSSSGLVRAPWSQEVVGRNVRGPSVWHGQRSHLGFGTSTAPNTVLIVCVPASLL